MNLTLTKINILNVNYWFKKKAYNNNKFMINELKRNNFIHIFKPANSNKNVYRVHVLTQKFGTYIADNNCFNLNINKFLIYNLNAYIFNKLFVCNYKK